MSINKRLSFLLLYKNNLKKITNMQRFQLHSPNSYVHLKCLLNYEPKSPQSYLRIQYTHNLQKYEITIFENDISNEMKLHIQNLKFLAEYLKQIHLTTKYQNLIVEENQITLIFTYKSMFKENQTIVKQVFKAQTKQTISNNQIGQLQSRIKKQIKNYVEGENKKLKIQINTLKEDIIELRSICQKLQKVPKSGKSCDQKMNEQSDQQRKVKKNKKIRKPYERKRKQEKASQDLNINNTLITEDVNANITSPILEVIPSPKQQLNDQIKLQSPPLQGQHQLLSYDQQKSLLLKVEVMSQSKDLNNSEGHQIDTLEEGNEISLVNSESQEYESGQFQRILEQKQQFNGPLVVTSRQATRYYYSKGHGKPKNLFRNTDKKLLDKKLKDKIPTMTLEQWCERYPITQMPRFDFLIDIVKLSSVFEDRTFYKKQSVKGFVSQNNKFMKLSSESTKMYRYFYLSLIARDPFLSVGKQYWPLRILGSVDLEIIVGVYLGEQKIKNDTFPRSFVGIHLGHGYIKDENETIKSNSGPSWRHILPESKEDSSLYLKLKQKMYDLMHKGDFYIITVLKMDQNIVQFYLNNILLAQTNLSKGCLKNKERIHGLVSIYNERDCIEIV